MFIVTFCTGNICRSPMAEYLMRHELHRRGISDDTIRLASAGTLRLDSRPIDPQCRALLAKDGIDASTHRSTPLTPDIAEQADLFLCFEERHIERLTMDAPAASRKTFLITDFANICDMLRERGDLPKATPEESLSTIRMNAPLLRPMLPEPEEIDDPYQLDPEDYERAHTMIKQSVNSIVSALAA
ncbi:arsenate reductase/protein-tyrosine-phosphatase family protein [Bifidobacterium vansinderenii]|uniref:Protein-tyrosine-phosphatase n=1 Tax=Bifidobacterium vansinderenii TaxID=1984871 RepID=A0A229VYM1_9BIFI|nr:hypothetical protein [Bifidobacterium vansinderenii]OXN00719.1 protein-tyrosine-phosphatase [Bifidobacterium vansinderenii]